MIGRHRNSMSSPLVEGDPMYDGSRAMANNLWRPHRRSGDSEQLGGKIVCLTRNAIPVLQRRDDYEVSVGQMACHVVPRFTCPRPG